MKQMAGTAALAWSPQACTPAGASGAIGSPAASSNTTRQARVAPASWPDPTEAPWQPGAGEPDGFGGSEEKGVNWKWWREEALPRRKGAQRRRRRAGGTGRSFHDAIYT